MKKSVRILNIDLIDKDKKDVFLRKITDIVEKIGASIPFFRSLIITGVDSDKLFSIYGDVEIPAKRINETVETREFTIDILKEFGFVSDLQSKNTYGKYTRMQEWKNVCHKKEGVQIPLDEDKLLYVGKAWSDTFAEMMLPLFGIEQTLEVNKQRFLLSFYLKNIKPIIPSLDFLKYTTMMFDPDLTEEETDDISFSRKIRG